MSERESTAARIAVMEQKAAQLRVRLNAEMAGRMVPTARAERYRRLLAEAEAVISALQAEERERAAMARIPLDDSLEILAVPLLAEVLADMATGVNETLRRAGLPQTTYTERVNRIVHESVELFSTLDHFTACPEITADDTLRAAVKKKVLSYIKQRLIRKRST